jgi:hypothetical protein
MAKKVVALVVLLIAVLGMAHWIETSARPDTGRTGVEVHGDHEH